MDRRHSDGHVAEDSKGRNASEQAEDKTQSTEEFRRNCQNREWGRNVHHAGEEAHRAGETISTEPPEQLLGAVREKYHPYTNRRIAMAASLSVAISLRNIEIPSIAGLLPGWDRQEIR
ncbi:MAG TPA: hypothetical protein VN911_18065 [Candidatus Acidoferrum sp.]|nr:hypothetical protein [Candidatus Acidoferrum sp.]